MSENIQVHKYDAEKRYKINQYPEWDTDKILGKDDYTLYSGQEIVYVAALPGDPPIYGVGDSVGEALNELETSGISHPVVVVDHTDE